MILRDKDANTAWSAQSDGTLEERVYYCQNWRNDVVALITDAGQVEQVRYSAYGVPFGLPAGDLDSDGDVDSDDLSVFDGLSSYDVRADLDLDGDNDSTDRSIIAGNDGDALGWGALSLDDVGSRKGYAGYEFDSALAASSRMYHVQDRVLNADIGRWTSRDPLGYVDGGNLYEYVRSNPIRLIDPTGKGSTEDDEATPSNLGRRPTKPPRYPPCGPGNHWCPLTTDPCGGRRHRRGTSSGPPGTGRDRSPTQGSSDQANNWGGRG